MECEIAKRPSSTMSIPNTDLECNSVNLLSLLLLGIALSMSMYMMSPLSKMIVMMSNCKDILNPSTTAGWCTYFKEEKKSRWGIIVDHATTVKTRDCWLFVICLSLGGDIFRQTSSLGTSQITRDPSLDPDASFGHPVFCSKG